MHRRRGEYTCNFPLSRSGRALRLPGGLPAAKLQHQHCPVVSPSGALGEGIAIVPSAGRVVAPCDATVSATMETKHAVGLTTAQGVELLIHVGLDTVALEGRHYTCKVKEGQKVKKGDLLIEFDMNAIKAEGYQLHTPVLVTNSDDFVSIKVANVGAVTAGDELMTVV